MRRTEDKKRVYIRADYSQAVLDKNADTLAHKPRLARPELWSGDMDQALKNICINKVDILVINHNQNRNGLNSKDSVFYYHASLF